MVPGVTRPLLFLLLRIPRFATNRGTDYVTVLQQRFRNVQFEGGKIDSFQMFRCFSSKLNIVWDRSRFAPDFSFWGRATRLKCNLERDRKEDDLFFTYAVSEASVGFHRGPSDGARFRTHCCHSDLLRNLLHLMRSPRLVGVTSGWVLLAPIVFCLTILSFVEVCMYDRPPAPPR